MRKIGISFLIIMLVFSIICIIPNRSLATTVSSDGAGAKPNGITSSKKNETTSGEFKPNDYKPDSTTEVKNGEKLKEAGNKMMGALMSVAAVISVTTFSWIGIKYMLGSVEEKAQYKKTLFPYLVGAIMVFGITTVIKIISAVAVNIPS